MERPGLGQRLQQTLGQHQLLLPRLLQSIEVLQLPHLELEAWLRRQAEENEALELIEVRPESVRPPRITSRGREATEAHDEMLQNQPDRTPGLAQRVAEELAMVEAEEAVLEWARFLVRCLDPRGFLTLDDGTLLQLGREQGLEGEADLLERAIAVLQSLEPRGIAARGAVHALLLQLDPPDPEYGLLRALLVDFLEDVARNKLPAVARALGVSLPELERLLARLRALDPRPAAALLEDSAPLLRPDVVVEPAGDGFEVRLDSARLPQVRIDERVAQLARDRVQPRDVRRYLRAKLDRARWLIDAVEQRERTLLRVSVALFVHQRAFLEHGPGHLVPLRMAALSSELGVHISTISRAVAGKYAQTPWGIFALRHFFQGPAGADEESAREGVLAALKTLVEAEDRHRPLSDDQVVAAMARKGWKLARRTVAKYRRELGIPSSYRRRRYDTD